MKVEKPLETVTISSEEYLEDNYVAPSKFYIRDAFGDAVFFKTRDRARAQQFVDNTYGKGMYTVRQVMKAQGR